MRISSANRPGHTIATSTDAGGRFFLSADDTGPASPAGDILRIEIIGQDYRASDELSPASLQVTCELGASSPTTSLAPGQRGLKCR
jgi:hypothetical protein